MAKTRETAENTSSSRAWVRVLALGVLGACAAFFVFGGLSRLGRAGPSDPFDAIPRTSFIAVTVDVAELRRSPLYEAIAGKDSSAVDPLRKSLGVSALADACGFDPTARVQRLAVSIPEEGERGEFGLAARIDVTREELETCARALSEQRGGHAETRDVGSFVVLEVATAGTATDAASSPRPRLAYGRGGLLVVGKGTWFDAMLGAADRAQPGLRDAEEHVALRTSLTDREGFRSPTLLATAVLPRALRERLKREMDAETAGQDASSATMAGVLGVTALGIAVHAGAPGQSLDASVELVCESAEACDAVDRLVKKKRLAWSGDLAMRMVGLGPLLDSFAIERISPTHLRATASAGAEALASTFERVMKLRARREPAINPPMHDDRKGRERANAQPAKPADEALSAGPDAGARREPR